MMENSGLSKVNSSGRAKDGAKRRHLMLGLLAGIGLGLIGYIAVVVLLIKDSSEVDLASSAGPQYGETTKEVESLSPGIDESYVKSLSRSEIVNQIENISRTELAELVAEVTTSDTTVSQTGVPLYLMGKLAQQDPQMGIELVWKFPRHNWGDLVTVVFSEWSIINLEEAITASLELRNELRDTALRSIIATRTDVANERWLALGSEQYQAEALRVLVREQEAMVLLDTPLDAIRLLQEDDVSDGLQVDLRTKFARTAIQREGITALKPLVEILAKTSRYVSLEFLDEDDSVQLVDVADALQDFPTEVRRNAMSRLTNTLFSDSPETAYDELSKLVDYQRDSWYWGIFSNWAEIDVEGFLDRIESFPRDERDYAASVGIRELAQDSPAEAAIRIETFRNVLGVDVLDLQDTLVRYWGKSEPTATLQWITENTEVGSRHHAKLLWTFLYDYVEKEPAKALDIALSQPPTSAYAERGSVSTIISKLTEAGEFELAMGALDRVPDAARSGAYSAVGRVLVEKDQWQEAIDLVAEFSEEDQFEHFRGLTFWGIWNDLEKMLATIPGIPSEKTRSQVAQAAIANHENFGNMLTEKQIEFLEQFTVVQ